MCNKIQWMKSQALHTIHNTAWAVNLNSIKWHHHGNSIVYHSESKLFYHQNWAAHKFTCLSNIQPIKCGSLKNEVDVYKYKTFMFPNTQCLLCSVTEKKQISRVDHPNIPGYFPNCAQHIRHKRIVVNHNKTVAKIENSACIKRINSLVLVYCKNISTIKKIRIAYIENLPYWQPIFGGLTLVSAPDP